MKLNFFHTKNLNFPCFCLLNLSKQIRSMGSVVFFMDHSCNIQRKSQIARPWYTEGVKGVKFRWKKRFNGLGSDLLFRKRFDWRLWVDPPKCSKQKTFERNNTLSNPRRHFSGKGFEVRGFQYQKVHFLSLILSVKKLRFKALVRLGSPSAQNSKSFTVLFFDLLYEKCHYKPLVCSRVRSQSSARLVQNA